MWEDGACASGGRPLWALTPFGDTGAGYLSALAIILGLIARQRCGEGQEVSTSLLNACLLNTSYVTVDEDGQELRQPVLDGDQRGISALCMLYPTATEWICINAVFDDHWSRLCTAIDRTELQTDARFSTDEARARNRHHLAALLEEVFKGQDADHWMDLFDRAGVPCEKSVPRTADEIFDDQELRRLGWVSSYDDAVLGTFDQAGPLVTLSRTPSVNHLTTPRVGEHSRAILKDLGYHDSDIDSFVSRGAVAIPDD
jgi:crotonobetainyl-CoA:carnitine CoA-transferase CaiB-like acyl-CoA transferase